MRAILLCLCLVALPAHARDWTQEEKAWGAAVLATRLVDWGQTRYIATHPHEFREANPILSNHPSLAEVNRHFIVGTALMFGAAHYMPQHRSTLLKVWFAVGVASGVRNAMIGVQIRF